MIPIYQIVDSLRHLYCFFAIHIFQHVLCGADADLIMLGLATHEPNFTIIRDMVVFLVRGGRLFHLPLLPPVKPVDAIPVKVKASILDPPDANHNI